MRRSRTAVIEGKLHNSKVPEQNIVKAGTLGFDGAVALHTLYYLQIRGISKVNPGQLQNTAGC